jgi:threonine dehydratase
LPADLGALVQPWRFTPPQSERRQSGSRDEADAASCRLEDERGLTYVQAFDATSRGETVAAVVSGGNVDLDRFRKIVSGSAGSTNRFDPRRSPRC